MKILYLGDPHVQVNNLEDSEKLLQFVLDTAKKEEVDWIVILGDLFHTHAILRVEVVNFWKRWLGRLSCQKHTFIICGNHDLQNQKDSKSLNALDVFDSLADGEYSRLDIIDKPCGVGPMVMSPYIHDSVEFITAINTAQIKNNSKVLICHQSFNGSQYDNGFYDPNGIDSNALNFEQIISGHIHGEASFGKVWHPGTAKWDSVSDANKQKQIWVCEHDDNTGLMTSKKAFSTWDICTPIISLTWSEGQEQPVLPERAISSIEIIGSASFVNKGKEIFKGKAKIKTKVTDKVVRENRKASASVLDFLDKVYKTSVNKEKLKNYLVEKNYV